MNDLLRILLVEDSADDAQLIAFQLEGERLEAEYQRVDNEADFITALESIPNLILSDYAMPRFNGLRALMILRERGLDIPFILISGTVGEDIAVDAIKQGAEDYLMKDRLGRLGFSVRHALEQKRLRDEKARADEALRQSQQAYQSLVNTVEGIVWEADANTFEFHFVSRQAERLLGYPIARWTKEPTFWKDHILPEDQAWAVDYCIACTREKRSHEFEYRMIAADGRIVWLRDIVSVIVENDQPVMLRGIMVDITARRQTEEKLRVSEERLNLALTAADDGLWDWQVQSGEAYFSPRWKAMIGYADEELPNNYESWESRLHPDDKPRILEALQAHFDDVTREYEPEFRMKNKAGEWVWIMARGRVVEHDQQGRPLRMVGTHTDINGRKQAEEALRRSEDRYRALFEDTPISIWEEDFSEVKEYLDSLKRQGITDFRSYLAAHPEVVYACAAKVRIMGVNKAALQVFHANSKEELLNDLGKILNPYAASNFREELIHIAEGRANFTLEGGNETLDGKRLDVSLTWSVAPGHEADLSRVIVSIIDITERKQAEERIERQLKRLNALHTIDKAISSSFELRTTLEIFLNEVIAQLEADAASVLLFNKDTLTLNYAASRGFRSSATQFTKLALGEGYAGQVVIEHRNIHIPNLLQSEGALAKSLALAGENFTSYFGAPLIAKGEIVGVLELFQRSLLHPDGEWLDFLENLASQAAIAIDNARLFEDLQRSNFELTLAYEATIEGWSQALDLRDKETEGHTQRVTSLTVKLARQMGISDTEIVHIRRGALLHDIGKMGVPDSILNKPDKLTDAEWEVMRQHPVLAKKMLASIGYLKPALDIPYCHHERWDGAGYPQGLSGMQIPPAARIFAVVDVWDALTSDRPYRNGWSKDEALAHIKAESGKHFDPNIVDHFLRMIREEINQEASVMQGKKF